jgi:hypothetical protein
MIRPIQVEELHRRVRSAAPFPHLVIDNFLGPDFARPVHDSFPTYDDALKIGLGSKTVNERKKIQGTDSTQFKPAVRAIRSSAIRGEKPRRNLPGT